jgi:hypothetical protein
MQNDNQDLNAGEWEDNEKNVHDEESNRNAIDNPRELENKNKKNNDNDNDIKNENRIVKKDMRSQLPDENMPIIFQVCFSLKK